MRAQGTHCPFTFIVKISTKNDSVDIAKKVSKINLRIISKSHAHLQVMIKTSVKLQKNQNKTVGGVACTRYPPSIHFHCPNVRKKDLSPIRMRQKYTRVNILRCANFTQGKQMAHANANTHRSIFTYG